MEEPCWRRGFDDPCTSDAKAQRIERRAVTDEAVEKVEDIRHRRLRAGGDAFHGGLVDVVGASEVP
jgi:hypothetical protein